MGGYRKKIGPAQSTAPSIPAAQRLKIEPTGVALCTLQFNLATEANIDQLATCWMTGSRRRSYPCIPGAAECSVRTGTMKVLASRPMVQQREDNCSVKPRRVIGIMTRNIPPVVDAAIAKWHHNEGFAN